jgi:hypothetical protein
VDHSSVTSTIVHTARVWLHAGRFMGR